ncbi:hypothetical protein K435DRAFT_855270 [Dendrothele bispora CBS 962.96]|uniref:Uncharacterized protein n=1 Tax=Dendrothele bispora (strain CBS 962.96) TaxID=1314807 RepID=A0A4S8MC78_DENBC|nr:hypothetical protein K435DRAFT_855270 [Dendrothele bispora CBS 962.96]
MSFNATVAQPGTYDTLYSGVDSSSLNWAEQKWVAWYVYWGNPVIATGLLGFLMHKKVPSKVPTPEEQWECTKQVLFAHFTVKLPTIWLFHPLALVSSSIFISGFQWFLV